MPVLLLFIFYYLIAKFTDSIITVSFIASTEKKNRFNLMIQHQQLPTISISLLNNKYIMLSKQQTSHIQKQLSRIRALKLVQHIKKLLISSYIHM